MPPVLGSQAYITRPHFHTGAGDVNLGLYADAASPLPTELPP